MSDPFEVQDHIKDYDLYVLRKQQAETDMKLMMFAEKIQGLLDEINHLKAKMTEIERRDPFLGSKQ